MACRVGREASDLLRSVVSNAVQSVYVATAFLDGFGAGLLKGAAERGVHVRLLASDRVDRELLERLAGSGVEVRVYDERFLHAKIYVVDGRAYVGSANLTRAALEESNVEVVCEVDAREAIRRFNELWSKAKPLESLASASAAPRPLFHLSEHTEGDSRLVELRVPDPDVSILLVNPGTPGEYMVLKADDVQFRALKPVKGVVVKRCDYYLSFNNDSGVVLVEAEKPASYRSILSLYELKGEYGSKYIGQFRPTRPLSEERAETARRLTYAIRAIADFVATSLARHSGVGDVFAKAVERLDEWLEEVGAYTRWSREFDCMLYIPARMLVAIASPVYIMVPEQVPDELAERVKYYVDNGGWLDVVRNQLSEAVSRYRISLAAYGVKGLQACIPVDVLQGHLSEFGTPTGETIYEAVKCITATV